MKKLWNHLFLPLLTLVLSGCGMFLSALFYTSASGTGEMLNYRHPLAVILLIFSGLMLVFLFLATRKIPTEGTLEAFLPASPVRSIGSFIGTVGIAISCIQIATATDFLTIISLILGIFGGVCMLFVGAQRLLKMTPHYLFYSVLTLFFMVMGLVRCRQWGAETQVLWFFFSLVAQVFLLLTAFQYTSMCAIGKNPRNLILFSHCAIFFCCLAFPARNDFFYLTGAIWLALDCSFFKIPKEE